jgi:hypothetical protein
LKKLSAAAFSQQLPLLNPINARVRGVILVLKENNIEILLAAY